MEISLVQLIKMMRDAAAGLVHLHRYLISALNSCYYYVIWMHSQLYSPKYCEVKLCVIATLLLAICWCVQSYLCRATPHLHPTSGSQNAAGATHADSHLNPYPHRWMTSYVFTCPTSASPEHCRRMTIMPHSCVCLGCRLSVCVRIDGMKLTYHTADCARCRPRERRFQSAGWPPRA